MSERNSRIAPSRSPEFLYSIASPYRTKLSDGFCSTRLFNVSRRLALMLVLLYLRNGLPLFPSSAALLAAGRDSSGGASPGELLDRRLPRRPASSVHSGPPRDSPPLQHWLRAWLLPPRSIG